MTRRFQKSVGPSVCPFVTLTKKAYFSIIDSRKKIRISGKRAYYPLQENEEIFSKKKKLNIRPNFRKNVFELKMPAPPSLLRVR